MAQGGAPARGLVLFSWELYLESQTCWFGPFTLYLFPTWLWGCPGEIHSPLPQVSGVEGEPSAGMEEKQPWGQRLEQLQQVVAQLEVDRSRLQRHNVQLRAALEQVTSVLSSLLRGPVGMVPTSGAAPGARAGKLQPEGQIQLLPISENKVLWEHGHPNHSRVVYGCLQATVWS